MEVELIPPYGGSLVSLLTDPDETRELAGRARELETLQLSSRAACDLELLATGAFSPLTRFMGHDDYRGVLENMRLADGTLFPIPITLPIPDGKPVTVGREIGLRSSKNDLLAVMRVEEIFERDPEAEALQVCGTLDASTRWSVKCASGESAARAVPLKSSPRPATTTSRNCAGLRPRYVKSLPRSVIRKWLPSRPAIRCTGFTRN